MPRIESGGSSGEGWSIPWRAVLLVALIGGSIWYGWRQYARLHPDIPRRVPGRVLNQQRQRYDPKNVTAGMKPYMDKIQLSDEQKKKIESAAKESTNALTFRRKAMQVLTEDQRKQVRDMQAKVAAERKNRQDEAKARKAGTTTAQPPTPSK